MMLVFMEVMWIVYDKDHMSEVQIRIEVKEIFSVVK